MNSLWPCRCVPECLHSESTIFLIDDPLVSEDEAHAGMGDDDFPSNELDENMGSTAEVWSTELLAGYF